MVAGWHCIARAVMGEWGGGRDATVIGSGAKTSCLNAITVNGIMLRYLDCNDTYLIPVGNLVLGCHPSELIPTVLALAEREGTNGRDMIATIVMGFELSGRFTDCCAVPGGPKPTIETKGFNTDSRGVFVMPVVAGRMLKLTEAQTVQALGISRSAGPILGILDATGEEYSMTKKWNNPKVLAMIDKATLKADPSLDQFGGAGISEIHLKNGRVVTKRVEYPAGDPKNPMSDAELEDKLRGMAEPYMSKKRIDNLIPTIHSLDKLETVEPLMKAAKFDRKID